uniref:Uncharacterized protein n=1 Tax=viral metagenome TaxID=1070528 RepID=A0A6M3XJE5_9ZZZZ
MTDLNFHISPIPGGSYAVRGYVSGGELDYFGLCLVEPRDNPGEYEICKWITRDASKADYIPGAIKAIKNALNSRLLTGTFEKRRMKIYERYFKKYGFEIPVIREFKKEYNGVVGEFCYVEIKERV